MQDMKTKLAFSIGKRLIADGKLTKNMKKPIGCGECPLQEATKAFGHLSCRYFNELILGGEVESKIHKCSDALDLVYNALNKTLRKTNRYLKI